ncbi:hypothetical protein [Streptomyces sp. NPDC004050]
MIGPDLVLTSAHVVGAVGEEASLFFPGRDVDHAARVVWRGTPGGRDDAALVKADAEGWTAPAGRPVRWGYLATDTQSAPCRSWGLPEAVQQPEYRDTAQPTGRINPGDRMIGNRYVMSLDDPLDVAPDAVRSPWGGLSGGALFSGDLLIGVIAVHPAEHRRRQLEAVPVWYLMRDEGFRAVLDAHVGLPLGRRFRGWSERLSAVEWQGFADRGDLATAGGRPSRSPAALLLARRAVVPFRGRAELLEQLTAWARQPGFDAVLVHGPGGQGKTRLAHHLGSALEVEGHVVLWPAARARPEDLETLKDSARALLVVVDYAETRIEQLAALLDAAAARVTDKPFKLLLLARTAGAWWDELVSSSQTAEALLEEARTEPLPVLEETAEGRQAAYREAVEALAGALPGVPGQEGHDWAAIAAGLPDPVADRLGDGAALSLHMMALADLLDTADPPDPDAVAVPGSGPGAGPASSREEVDMVEDRLLRHEARYWKGAAVSSGLLGRAEAVLGRVLTDTLTAAFLLGAHNRVEASSLLGDVPGLLQAARADQWLAGLYPAESEDWPWGTLQPDRLAERFVGRRLAADPTLPDRLLAHGTARQAEQLLTVYARAAAHPAFRGALDAGLTALCGRQYRTLALAALHVAGRTERPAPLVTALGELAERPDLDLDTLVALAVMVPEGSVVLASWAVRISQRLVLEYQRDAPEVIVPVTDREPRTSLGWGAAPGSDPHAFIGRSVVVVADDSSGTEPGTMVVRMPTNLFGYLTALNALARRLDLAGRTVEAREVGAEAYVFGNSVSNALSRPLENPGPDGGSTSGGSAFGGSTFGGSSAGSAADILSEFASVMESQALRFASAARYDEALVLAERACWLQRRLYESGLTTLNPAPARLAQALQVLGRISSLNGQTAQAREATAEANGILRGLMAPSAPWTLKELAGNLRQEAHLVFGDGDQATGVRLAEEAVALLREAVAAAGRDRYGADLLSALSTLADLLHDAVRRQEEAVVREEAVTLARELAKALPAAHTVGLATELMSQALTWNEQGDHAEGLAAGEEAEALLREAYAVDPERYAIHLALCLKRQGQGLVTAGFGEAAYQTLEEAVERYRELARQAPRQFRVALADSTAELCRACLLLGKEAEALRWIRRTVALLRRHSRVAPEEARPGLAQAQARLASILTEQGRFDEASAAAEEAVAACRAAVGDGPPAEAPHIALSGLAVALLAQWQLHFAMERGEEAVAAALEAAQYFEVLEERVPGGFLVLWATAEANAGVTLAALGRHTEGIEHLEAAADVRSLLAADTPGPYTAMLAVNLTQLAQAYARAGRSEESRAAAERAIATYSLLVPHVPAGFYDEELEFNRSIRDAVA